MATPKVLVTGMSGLLGNAVRNRLDSRFDLTALNRRPVPGIKSFEADIAEIDAIRSAFQGQDTVVHLAGYCGYEWNDLLRTNIIGLYNVFEASREAGVRRIIFASSGASIAGWQRVDPYKSALERSSCGPATSHPMLDHQTLPRPTGIYGCTKVWGEALAWDYSEAFEMSIICLRFGPITPTDRPVSREAAHAWCSQRDAAQMVERCIEAPATLKFDIFNVISNNNFTVRDISHARKMVGYEPLDSADQYVTDDGNGKATKL